MNITNKAVLITGANRGIGQALVSEALRRGTKKVYAGTRGPLQHFDQRVIPLTLDVTNTSQIRQAVDQVDALDVLINNAGIALYDDLTDFAVAEAVPRLDRQQRVLGRARFLACYPFLFDFEGRRVQRDAITASTLGESRRSGPRRHSRSCRHRYEPRSRHTQGLARGCRAGNFRWVAKRRRRYLSGSGVPVDRRCLARERCQSARAPIRGFHPTERSVSRRWN